MHVDCKVKVQPKETGNFKNNLPQPNHKSQQEHFDKILCNYVIDFVYPNKNLVHVYMVVFYNFKHFQV